jgi:hypothetical protein
MITDRHRRLAQMVIVSPVIYRTLQLLEENPQRTPYLAYLRARHEDEQARAKLPKSSIGDWLAIS